MKYRIVARGFLEEDDKILFIEYKDKQGDSYFALPGGQQERGVDLVETVQREFREETGLEVEVVKILSVSEFIHGQSDVPGWENGIHQLEVIFACQQVGEFFGERVQDENMVGLKWIHYGDLAYHKTFPGNLELKNDSLIPKYHLFR